MPVQMGDNRRSRGPVGPVGPTGMSAYAHAVASGHPAETPEEWLASLVGPQGAAGLIGGTGAIGPVGPVGPTGNTGPAGNDGLSAYQIAVNGGFGGNQAAWLASLVGPAGATGSAGSPANTLMGTVTIGETAIVAITAGIRRVTVSLAGVVTTGRYQAFPTAALAAGYATHDCICGSNGNLTIGLSVPLITIGNSYSIQCAIVRINT